MEIFKSKIVSIYKDKTKLKKTTNWLISNLQEFAIKRDYGEEIPWRIKPVGELIFLLMAMKKNDSTDSRIDQMCQFCLEQTQNFDWHELAVYDPSIVSVIYSLKEFYQTLECSVPWEEEFVATLKESDFFEAMDRVPYREMDVIYSRSLAEGDDGHLLNNLAQWFNDTTFGREQISTRYTIDDMYSVTHAIFYLTEMGTRPIGDVIDAQLVERMHETLVTLAVSIARANNIDVLGEILICWIYAGVPKTPLNEVIFDSMLDHILSYQTLEGAVAPSPRVFEKATRSEAVFKELYHTTLVSTLLFINLPKWQKRKSHVH